MNPAGVPCTESAPLLLEFESVTKVFPNGTIALSGVSFRVHAGSVHGLVGANGAGKSTLVKILAGAHRATAGTVRWKNEPQHWARPADAHQSGIATIHQHIPLAPTLSVLENIFIRSTKLKRGHPTERSDFDQLVARVGYAADPDAIVRDLPIGERQMVAILQALASGADLIVMDEPTASLADSEREAVFAAIDRLKSTGTTFIYVSHFLDEVIALTDEITVLRDGRVVANAPTAELDEADIVEAIIGEPATDRPDHRRRPATEVQEMLRVEGLSSPRGIDNISFDVAAGEILGLAGLLGSGRSEILHAIYRADSRATGSVKLLGREVGASTAAAVDAGMGLVPEDRNTQGLMLDKSLTANIALPALAALANRLGIVHTDKERDRASQGITSLGIVAAGPDAPVSSLSGGNAQKVLFARWILSDTILLMLDEPTAGVDVGAKAEIAAQIRDFAEAGGAVILVDTEFDELLRVADRVLVLRSGRIIAERSTYETDEHELLALASGLGHRESA